VTQLDVNVELYVGVYNTTVDCCKARRRRLIAERLLCEDKKMVTDAFMRCHAAIVHGVDVGPAFEKPLHANEVPAGTGHMKRCGSEVVGLVQCRLS